MTCRGFMEYCRSVIDYAKKAPDGSMPKFYAINPAHSNSSILEAWFSAVRNTKSDSTPSYAHFVGNRDMKKANADIALKKNPMYSTGDVGEIRSGKLFGPKEMIKYHSGRELKMHSRISEFEAKKTYTRSSAPVSAFSSVCRDFIPENIAQSESDVLKRLSSKVMKNGYLEELLRNEYFRQWMRLSIGTQTEQWFTHLLEICLDDVCAQQFENTCISMQNKMFELTVKSMKRRKDEGMSFEYDLHSFHRSTDFSQLCQTQLPGTLSQSHPSTVILYLCLACFHSVWLKEALYEARKIRNPELFQRKVNRKMTTAEENSEVNRFFGWAIFSTMKRFTGDSSTHLNKISTSAAKKNILLDMMLREREIDDDYMSKYYDGHMSLLNRGGLTLVSGPFFEFGKNILNKVRSAFNTEALERNPKNAFKDSKKEVMNNSHLRTEFMQLCKDRSLSTENAASVYQVFLRKTIHARFTVVFRAWKEQHVKKNGSVTLRQKLKVQSDKSGEGKKRSLTPQAVTPGGECSKKRRLEWKDLTVPCLKDELRKRKLVLKGKKGDLIQRLQEYEQSLNDNFEAMDCDAEFAALDICSLVALSKSPSPSASSVVTNLAANTATPGTTPATPPASGHATPSASPASARATPSASPVVTPLAANTATPRRTPTTPPASARVDSPGGYGCF